MLYPCGSGQPGWVGAARGEAGRTSKLLERGRPRSLTPRRALRARYPHPPRLRWPARPAPAVYSFGWTRYDPAFVFPDNLGANNKAIAEAISHEAGHRFGLHHDGVTGSNGSVQSYYGGHGNWAPIMGVGRRGAAPGCLGLAEVGTASVNGSTPSNQGEKKGARQARTSTARLDNRLPCARCPFAPPRCAAAGALQEAE
jgi:hypothetical protein